MPRPFFNLIHNHMSKTDENNTQGVSVLPEVDTSKLRGADMMGTNAQEVRGEGFEGTPFFFNEEGEQLAGVYVGLGRKFQEGTANETHTLRLIDLEEDGTIHDFITPMMTALVSRVYQTYMPDGTVHLTIIHNGKKKSQSSGNEYVDFRVLERKATKEEKEAAQSFLPIS